MGFSTVSLGSSLQNKVSMKIKNIVTILLVGSILVSCAPAAKVVPTETIMPTSTFTPVPATLTITPTPAPENIADAKDLPVWIKQFVNAYGGKVTITGVEMDVNQLTDEIRKNAETFTEVKEIESIMYSFLVVNGVPLALMGEDGKWSEITLRELADDKKITIGMTPSINLTESWSPDHIIVSQILNSGNTLKLDYDLMWWLPPQEQQADSLRPSLLIINYNNIDKALRYSQKYNQGLVAQTLLVQNPYFLPQWLKEITDKTQLKDVATKHIQSLVAKYPQIDEWTVMAEFENPYFSNIWTKTFGLSDVGWIVDVYNTAHSANPNAKLTYSDFDIEFGGVKADRVFGIIKNIKEAGAPIDIIAFQMHISGKDFIEPSIRSQRMQEFAEQIKRYQDIGIQVEIGEMDIAMNGTSLDTEHNAIIQAEIYKAVMDTALDNGVNKIYFFGINDKYSWKNLPENGGGAGAIATLFGINGELKPSYYSVIQALYEHVP